jgi:hypothetical protein
LLISSHPTPAITPRERTATTVVVRCMSLLCNLRSFDRIPDEGFHLWWLRFPWVWNINFMVQPVYIKTVTSHELE